VKNDSGEIIGYQYQVADADITARTVWKYTDTLGFTHTVFRKSGKRTWRVWGETPGRLFLIGRRQLPYKEYTALTCAHIFYLEEHFPFPVSVRIEQIEACEKKEISYTKKEVQEILTYDLEKFCARLKKKGVQISENDVKIYRETNQYSAKGELVLSGPFGSIQKGAVY